MGLFVKANLVLILRLHNVYLLAVIVTDLPQPPHQTEVVYPYRNLQTFSLLRSSESEQNPWSTEGFEKKTSKLESVPQL